MFFNIYPSKPRILFATIAAGGAHVSTAEAMAQAIERVYPERFEIQISEIMRDFGFEVFDKRHKETWRWALSHPWSVHLGQALSDGLPQLSVTLQRRMLDGFAKCAAERLKKNPPDLIVVNHGWLNTALTLSKQRYALKTPIVTFVTLTVDASSIWVEPLTERYIIGAERGKRILIKLGMPEQSIDVIGYPVKHPFLDTLNKQEARAQLGLEEKFTCLVALGGEGVGNNPKSILSWLKYLRFSHQIVIITGRNKKLKEELAALKQPNLRVEGFVNNMQTFMASSDVVIGKVSGATVFECLAVGRPIIATRKSYRSENEYITYLSEKKLGGFAPDRNTFLNLVTEYFEHPEKLIEVQKQTKNIDFSGMATRIAHYLVHYLETGKPDFSQVSTGVGWE